MDTIDDLTREKLRDWQRRRLEIKDQMQSQPEHTLALAQVLDLMDEEHAAILAASTRQPVDDEPESGVALEHSTQVEEAVSSVASAFVLQLSASANSLADLRKMLEMAVHEVGREMDSEAQQTASGGMSGSLGDYQFELRVRPAQ